jgi:carbon monoxide dehydrogenase subunit G
MAYLREDKEKIEIDYPLEKVWAAIPDVVKGLEWKTLEKDDNAHKMKVKTKKGFIAYGSDLTILVTAVDEQTTQVAINGETPVTTITSMADFGRTRDRIEMFIEGLALVIDRSVHRDKAEGKDKGKKKK